MINTNNNLCLNHNNAIKYLLIVYFFICYFEPYLNVFLGSYVKYFIFIIIFSFLLFNRFKIRISHLGNYFLLWIVYKTITLAWTRDTYIFEIHFLTNLATVVLLYLISSNYYKKETIDECAKAIWFGSSTIGILTLLFNTAYLGNSTRIVLNLFGESIDPNNSAAFLTLGIAVAIYYLFIKRELIVFAVVTVLVNTFSILLSGSRGGLLTVIGIIFLFSVFYIRKGKNKLLFIFVFFALVLLSGYLINAYLPHNIYTRLFEFNTYEGGSERTTIWLNALELLNQNPIYYVFGAGWGAYYGFNGYYLAMHNTYLSMLCDVGLIGLAFFFIPIFSLCKRFINDERVLPIILLAAGFIPSLFLESINKRFFWNVIIFAIMYSNMVENDEDRQKAI